MTKADNATSPAVDSPVDRWGRPVAYRLFDSEAQSWVYYSDDELHPAVKKALEPLYDRAALDAAMATERERWAAPVQAW